MAGVESGASRQAAHDAGYKQLEESNNGIALPQKGTRLSEVETQRSKAKVEDESWG